MPEGDTIFRTARTLHQALAGRVVTRFETVLPKLARVDDQSPLKGRVVQSVESQGKNVIMTFSGDLILRTHRRMNGSWHIYRPGERWQRRRDDMRIVISTEDMIAVGFNIPVAEFLTSPPRLSLGPDLLGETFDMPETIRRIREHPREEIGNVLLNQRVLAGIGNIYKSESLFRAKVNPFTKVEAIDDATLHSIVTAARRLLRKNAASRDEPWHVYGRRGEQCRKCGALIERRAQGPDARLTYWCPQCQR